MKIVVNTIPLLFPKTGIGHYIYNLFSTIHLLDHKNEYTFFYGKSFSKNLYHTSSHSITKIRDFLKKVPVGLNRFSFHTFNFYFWLKGSFEDFDLYHETNYIPFHFKGKKVVTIFDLSFISFPETHPKDRIIHFRRHFHSRIYYTDCIITLSNFVKKEIIEYLKISPLKIVSIPLAAGMIFTPLNHQKVRTFLKNKGYPDNYILYVGTIEPRKNLRLLINAFSRVHDKLNSKYFLVIIGAKGWNWENDLKLIDDLGLKDSVVVPGYVPEEDLPHLYNGAKLFVYPSLYEGFGLPVLEAMACGVPVITSNSSALPEVVGKAGIMVNPFKVEELTEAIHSVLKNDNLQQEMRERGIEQAKLFSWEKCAQETINVYEKLIC